MENKLLIEGMKGPANKKADRSLLRLIGQAHRFHKLMDAADHEGSMAEIAKTAGVSSSYFTRVLRVSFLSPEITKIILQGRQPPELTANRIMTGGKLPPSWATQKKQLGLA